MESLIKYRDMFQTMLNEASDGFMDEPLFLIDYGDFGEVAVDTAQYFDDYCTSCQSDEVHIFTDHYHYHYIPEHDELGIYYIFHFNTREYGVPREYERDELHDATDSYILIQDDSFWIDDEQYFFGKSPEEKFQLSCTDLGSYIDVVERVKSLVLEDITKNGNPKV